MGSSGKAMLSIRVAPSASKRHSSSPSALSLKPACRPSGLGVSVRPDQKIAAGGDGRQGRIGRRDLPLGGRLRIVRQVQAARVDGHAPIVVDLDPIVILALRIGFRRSYWTPSPR